MKKISIISQKGGVGKSTIIRHLAVQASGKHKVAVADLDAQGTTKKWLLRRMEARITPEISILETNTINLQKMSEKAKSNGIEWLFIDTPPAHDDTRAAKAAISIADLILIPTKASPDDIEAIVETVKLVKVTKKNFCFILNMTKRCNLLTQSRELLSTYGDLAETEIRDSVAFPEASMQGYAINEISPKHKGSQDMNALWKCIREKI